MTTLSPAFARTLTAARTATTTRELTDIISRELHGEQLTDLVQLETDATNFTHGMERRLTTPVMIGIGAAVRNAAKAEVNRLITGATTNRERAEKLLDIMRRDNSNLTVTGHRERGATHTKLVEAELVEAADFMLDDLMLKVHDVAWFDMQEEPLAKAIAGQEGNTIYRDFLHDEITKL